MEQAPLCVASQRTLTDVIPSDHNIPGRQVSYTLLYRGGNNSGGMTLTHPT